MSYREELQSDPWGTDFLAALRLLERSFDDNPLGQSDEQTPIGIWREVS